MPVTYNLKSLPTFDAAAHLRVEAAVSPEQAFAYAPFTFPGRHRGRHVPAPPRGLPDRLSLGTLSWPVGAARFAHGHFLCDDATLARWLRPWVYTPGSGSYAPKVLTLSDGSSDGTVSASLYLLPPVPLFQTSASLWLLTFVDERFFWWEKSLDLLITDGTTTWANVFGAIGTALGVTITPDAIPAAYGKPPGNLAGHYDHLPLLLDAVCAAVGHRLVRNLAGTVVTQAPRAARARQDANLLAQEPTRRGGGKLALDRNDRANDLNGLAPASVRVLFPRQSTATPPAAFTYPVGVTLQSLNLPEYQGVAGRPASVTAPTDLPHPAVYTGGNAAALATLATQAATDYYLWLLGRAEVRYDGIRPWLPSGMDAVEWSHHAGAVLTTARRAPWDAGPPAAPPGVNVSDGTTTYPGVTTITVNPPVVLTPPPAGQPPGVTITVGPGASPGPPAVASRRQWCEDFCVNGALLKYCFFVYVAPSGGEWLALWTVSQQGCCDCPGSSGVGSVPGSSGYQPPCIGFPVAGPPVLLSPCDDVIGDVAHPPPDGAYQAGDPLCLVVLETDDATVTLNGAANPAGWTKRTDVTVNHLRQRAYTKVGAGLSAAEAVIVLCDHATTAVWAYIFCLKNCGDIEAWSGGTGTAATGDSVTAPSVTGTAPANVLVCPFGWRDAAALPRGFRHTMPTALPPMRPLTFVQGPSDCPPNVLATSALAAWDLFPPGATPAETLKVTAAPNGMQGHSLLWPVQCPQPGSAPAPSGAPAFSGCCCDTGPSILTFSIPPGSILGPSFSCAHCDDYVGDWVLRRNPTAAYAGNLDPAPAVASDGGYCVYDSGDTDLCFTQVTIPRWIGYFDGLNWWLLFGGGFAQGQFGQPASGRVTPAMPSAIGLTWLCGCGNFDCTGNPSIFSCGQSSVTSCTGTFDIYPNLAVTGS